MKKDSLLRPSILPYFTLIAGAVGLVLRAIYLKTQMDPGGLLTANHPLSILTYILTAVTLAVVAVCVLPLKILPRRYRRPFRKTTRAALGCTAAGIGTLIANMLQLIEQETPFNMIITIMSFVVAACFGFLAYARQKGTRPHYLVHAGIIVYLMLNLVFQYRLWSPQPQLNLYFFPLMASVCLMFAAYQALCLDIRKEDRRGYAFFNQAALFFCCLSLVDSQWIFYLGMGIYCATNLCSLRVSHSYYEKKEEAPAEEVVTQTSETDEEA